MQIKEIYNDKKLLKRYKMKSVKWYQKIKINIIAWIEALKHIPAFIKVIRNYNG